MLLKSKVKSQKSKVKIQRSKIKTGISSNHGRVFFGNPSVLPEAASRVLEGLPKDVRRNPEETPCFPEELPKKALSVSGGLITSIIPKIKKIKDQRSKIPSF
jgi:hypothetical protein